MHITVTARAAMPLSTGTNNESHQHHHTFEIFLRPPQNHQARLLAACPEEETAEMRRERNGNRLGNRKIIRNVALHVTQSIAFNLVFSKRLYTHTVQRAIRVLIIILIIIFQVGRQHLHPYQYIIVDIVP